jgi:hypothetical protein
MGLAHTIGHIASLKEWKNPPDERTRILITTMTNYTLGDFPVDRSMTSIYLGFSLFVAATPMMLAAIILVASKALQEDRPNLRRLTRIYLAGLLVLSAISVNYFVWPPTLFLLTAFGFAAWAMAGLRKA